MQTSIARSNLSEDADLSHDERRVVGVAFARILVELERLLELLTRLEQLAVQQQRSVRRDRRRLDAIDGVERLDDALRLDGIVLAGEHRKLLRNLEQIRHRIVRRQLAAFAVAAAPNVDAIGDEARGEAALKHAQPQCCVERARRMLEQVIAVRKVPPGVAFLQRRLEIIQCITGVHLLVCV